MKRSPTNQPCSFKGVNKSSANKPNRITNLRNHENVRDDVDERIGNPEGETAHRRSVLSIHGEGNPVTFAGRVSLVLFLVRAVLDMGIAEAPPTVPARIAPERARGRRAVQAVALRIEIVGGRTRCRHATTFESDEELARGDS